MKITKATILLTDGADIVIITTNLPSPMPAVSDQNLSLKFEVEADKGEDYIGANFPSLRNIHVTNTRRNPK